jgi:hypothetical protein
MFKDLIKKIFSEPKQQTILPVVPFTGVTGKVYELRYDCDSDEEFATILMDTGICEYSLDLAQAIEDEKTGRTIN